MNASSYGNSELRCGGGGLDAVIVKASRGGRGEHAARHARGPRAEPFDAPGRLAVTSSGCTL